ncbi:hypothetical protein C8J56DRAFT_903964 [Mycena floridula]|nr:hypothetical protein C8J56DRAFT_903964 [Mycena floridula]
MPTLFLGQCGPIPVLKLEHLWERHKVVQTVNLVRSTCSNLKIFQWLEPVSFAALEYVTYCHSCAIIQDRWFTVHRTIEWAVLKLERLWERHKVVQTVNLSNPKIFQGLEPGFCAALEYVTYSHSCATLQGGWFTVHRTIEGAVKKSKGLKTGALIGVTQSGSDREPGRWFTVHRMIEGAVNNQKVLKLERLLERRGVVQMANLLESTCITPVSDPYSVFILKMDF